jgi:hypothetical protein
MSDNKLTDERGLYQLPDVPDDAPQGSVSAPVSAMGRADAPQKPSAMAVEAARQLADWTEDFVTYRGGWSDKMMAIVVEQFAHDLDAFAAARVAEAVAQERARWRGTVFTEIQRLKVQRNRQKSNGGIREYQAKIEALTGLLHITQGDVP